MDITLNKPKLPYTNRYYRHFMEVLCDGNIYDVSDVTTGLRRAGNPPYTRKAFAIGLDFAPAPPPGLDLGMYYYVVVALFSDETEGPPSNELSYNVVSTGGGLTVSFAPVTGAIGYKIFRTNVSGSYETSLIATLDNATFSFLDNGISPTAGVPLFSFVILSGQVSPAGLYSVSLNIWNSNDQAFSTLATKSTNADGSFEFLVCPPRGQNEIYASVGVMNSPSVFVNAYNLHLYFEMIANEMLIYAQKKYDQISANAHLEDTEGVLDTSLISPEYSAVDEVWGQLVGVFRPSGMSLDDYRALIKSVRLAYGEETTLAAIITFWNEISGNPTNRNGISFLGFGNTGFKLGSSGKFYVPRTSPPTPTLTFAWPAQNVWWQDRTGETNFFETQRGYIQAGTMDVPGSEVGLNSGNYVVYIDGTRDANGYFVVKLLKYGFTPIPDNARVMAVVYQVNGDIIQVTGQGRLGTTINPPLHTGWAHICDYARLNSPKYKGSRFFVFFDNILGANYMTDPEFSEKVTMVKNILKAIKPAKTTIFFATQPDVYYSEV